MAVHGRGLGGGEILELLYPARSLRMGYNFILLLQQRFIGNLRWIVLINSIDRGPIVSHLDGISPVTGDQIYAALRWFFLRGPLGSQVKILGGRSLGHDTRYIR